MDLQGQYRALRETAGIGSIGPVSVIAVGGPDRASFLHGLLTNDIKALTPGRGCYAAWLTPQGRMLTDMHVFDAGDEILLALPSSTAAATLQRLDQHLFSEDVRLSDRSSALTPVWIHGPEAASILERAVQLEGSIATWDEYQHGTAGFGPALAIVARVSQLGVPGFCVLLEPSQAGSLQNALLASGAAVVEAPAIEAARIEAGYPLFGVDMTEDTIPLEAGIEDRAISFTKGCYVGQEIIIRVLHRGQGRVARRLVGLRLEGAPPARGATIKAGEREAGWVTSAATSPSRGPIAMGYLQRDYTSPGTRVSIDTQGGLMLAEVSELRQLSISR